MRKLTVVAAALAAAALGAAAPAMAATDFIFKIDVTSADGVSGFTPFSFTETYSLGSGSFIFIPFPTFAGGLTGVSGDPLTADLLTGAGVNPADITTDYSFSELPFFPGFGFAGGDLTQIAGGGLGTAYYQQQISAFSGLGPIPPTTDLAGFAELLRGAPSPWREQGTSADLTFSETYFGTATLISPAGVPEPAAWSLMILGFGGLGAALRRSRAVSLA